LIDQYSGDSGIHPPWDQLAAMPFFYGAIIKAWEGTSFNDRGWFQENWNAVWQAGADRYGVSWFRGAYLFLKFMKSGTEQADAYLNAIEQAGGWGGGDILPIVDVELGGEANSNRQASAAQVVECVTECADRLRAQTGRRVMLYGRGAMRDLGISDRMGCDVVWNPSYTARMVRNGLQAWNLEDIVLWQYCGDNFAAYHELPNTVDGFRKVDISVFINGAERPTLQDVRERLLA
jgi:lysozyme